MQFQDDPANEKYGIPVPDNSPEDQKNTKLSIIAGIFKYLGLTTLALLIFAAIITQAPWKVTAGLFVLFTMNTLLPRAAIKWLWVIILFLIIAFVVWILLPADQQGWEPYKFQNEINAFHQKYSVPPDANAAVIYNRIFAEYDFNDLAPQDVNSKIYDHASEEPWKTNKYPELAKWLDSRRNLLEDLQKINDYEKCYFHRTPDIFELEESMDNLAKARKLLPLLSVSANNDFAQDRIDQAVSKSLTTLQVGRHFQQQPSVIEYLVGIALEALAIDQLESFSMSGKLDSNTLESINKNWPPLKKSWQKKVNSFLDFERLHMKSMLAGLYQVNTQGQTRINPNHLKSITKWAAQTDHIPDTDRKPGYLLNRLGKFSSALGRLWLPKNPQQISYLVDSAYAAIYFDKIEINRTLDMNEVFSTTGPYGIPRTNFRSVVENMVKILQPAIGRIAEMHNRTLTIRRGTYLVLAIAGYHNRTADWPESLDDIEQDVPPLALKDAYTGADFVYEKTDKNFRLYSIGPNGKDDGGLGKQTAPAPEDADDWLIWPVPEQTSAEKQDQNKPSQPSDTNDITPESPNGVTVQHY